MPTKREGYTGYRVNCVVCKSCKALPSLKKRIRLATYHRQDGDETLGDIAREFGFSTASIYNHSKKHIRDVQTDGNKEIRVAKKVIDLQANVQKELELQLDKQTVDEIDARPMEIVGLDELIAQGIAEIRKGGMKLTATQFIAAAKVKSDWAGKQQTNKVEILRTIASFRSGSKKLIEGETNDTKELTEGTYRGEDESHRICRAAFGDEVTRRAEEILDGVVQTKEED